MHRLPVVDHRGRLVGVVSRPDVFEPVLDEPASDPLYRASTHLGGSASSGGGALEVGHAGGDGQEEGRVEGAPPRLQAPFKPPPPGGADGSSAIAGAGGESDGGAPTMAGLDEAATAADRGDDPRSSGGSARGGSTTGGGTGGGGAASSGGGSSFSFSSGASRPPPERLPESEDFQWDNNRFLF